MNRSHTVYRLCRRPPQHPMLRCDDALSSWLIGCCLLAGFLWILIDLHGCSWIWCHGCSETWDRPGEQPAALVQPLLELMFLIDFRRFPEISQIRIDLYCVSCIWCHGCSRTWDHPKKQLAALIETVARIHVFIDVSRFQEIS